MNKTGRVTSRGPQLFLASPSSDTTVHLLTKLLDINAVAVATAADTCIAVDKDGKAYSWGFSGTYQTGLGTTDDVDEATLIDNTAVRGKKLVFAGVGGQFGVLGGAAEDVPANGI